MGIFSHKFMIFVNLMGKYSHCFKKFFGKIFPKSIYIVKSIIIYIKKNKDIKKDNTFVNELSSIYSVIFHLIICDWIDE